LDNAAGHGDRDVTADANAPTAGEERDRESCGCGDRGLDESMPQFGIEHGCEPGH
jgi:hypothetical protein